MHLRRRNVPAGNGASMTHLTLTERVAELERELWAIRQNLRAIREADAEKAGLIKALMERAAITDATIEGMGQHFDDLLNGMGIVWPETARAGDGSKLPSPSILRAYRLKSKPLAGGAECNVSASPPFTSPAPAKPAEPVPNGTTTAGVSYAPLVVRPVRR